MRLTCADFPSQIFVKLSASGVVRVAYLSVALRISKWVLNVFSLDRKRAKCCKLELSIADRIPSYNLILS